jgi:hypothetical protein
MFLAVMVLGWGTGYKMSLYHGDGNSSPSVPAAKLLSQRERPSTTQVVDSLLPAPPNHQPSANYPAILVVALLVSVWIIVSLSMLEDELDNSRKERSAHTSYFSFRPPPAFLPSN